MAKSWFRAPEAAPPEELLLFLHRSFPPGQVILTDAYPECIVALDRFGGEHRNTDLLVVGTAGPQKLAISIEAKADEPFGDQLVGPYYDRRRAVPGSNLPARIDALSRALFNRDLDSGIRSLRYQLLHGTAGALIAAKGHSSDVSVFLVHEFISDRLNPAKLERNKTDWQAFVNTLVPDHAIVFYASSAIGPIQVPGGQFVPADIPLYLGEIRTWLP